MSGTAGGAAARQILVVDDEDSIRFVFGRFLKAEGHGVRFARDGVEALEEIERERPDLLILDFHMPRMNGPRLLQELASRGIAIPVIVTSSFDQVADATDVFLEYLDYLPKPPSRADVLQAVDRALLWLAQQPSSRPT